MFQIVDFHEYTSVRRSILETGSVVLIARAAVLRLAEVTASFSPTAAYLFSFFKTVAEKTAQMRFYHT